MPETCMLSHRSCVNNARLVSFSIYNPYFALSILDCGGGGGGGGWCVVGGCMPCAVVLRILHTVARRRCLSEG